MIAKLQGFSLNGLSAKSLTIECDLSNGLPGLSIIGTGASSAEDIRQRVRGAIQNSGLSFPRKRITINLAPAGEASDGAMYDLAIALAILVRSEQLSSTPLQNTQIVGELGLDGSLRPVRGILNMARQAAKDGKILIAPASNRSQLSLVPELMVCLANSLQEVYELLINQTKPPLQVLEAPSLQSNYESDIDFAEVVGQAQAKRALEIAASGNHNILMTGPPGTGKSMLAKATIGILPPLSLDEVCEVSQIHSLVTDNPDRIHEQRPFRSPHHSASHIAIIGGGQNPRPGEISLSHGGVLFLDEIAEFSKQSLEVLRQPLEDRKITLARARKIVEYPANFMLIATMNPCPCGYFGDINKSCSCTIPELLSYQKKLSGPILDRIDLQVRVERVEPNNLQQLQLAESSHAVRQRVSAARKRQELRYGHVSTNNAMTSAYIRKHWLLDDDSRRLLIEASEKLQLSVRSHFKVLRVARTIADLEEKDNILQEHIMEALQYRLPEPSVSTVHA